MRQRLLLPLMALAIGITSCGKDEISTVQPALQTASGNKVITVTGMCPNNIHLAGNSKGGNKVKATFDPNNTPALIKVLKDGAATNDAGSTAGNSGEWISTDKYLSPELALQLYDANGQLICTCGYDANGQLKPEVVAVDIHDFTARQVGMTNVQVSFTSTAEQNLLGFMFLRFEGGLYNWGGFLPAQGSNSVYTFTDNEMYGVYYNFEYQIRAVYQNGTQIEFTPVSPTPMYDAHLATATAVYDGTKVNVKFTSDIEINVWRYVIERTNLNTGGVDKTILSPVWYPGNLYNLVDNEIFDDIAVYSYSITALYADNTTKVLATNIPVTR